MTTHSRPRRDLGLAVIAFLVGSVAFVGCDKTQSHWDQAAASAQAAAATKPETSSADTGSFNKFFPPDGADGAARVFSADKPGYAEAKLTKDGKEYALLAVTDLEGKDLDKTKFQGATETVEGSPVYTFGKNKTMILVKGRYQVSASSATLDNASRKALLAKFDLRGLAAL